jgi:hypothetical protein
MESLLERLKAGTKNTKTVKFPGTEEDVVIRILSEADRVEAHFAAERYFQAAKIEVSGTTVEAYEAEKTLQMIYRAINDMEGSRLARTVDDFRKGLSRPEKDFLVDEYLALEAECVPGDGEDLDSLVETLKKSPEEISSIGSIFTARRLITSLVNQLSSLQRDNGSTSSSWSESSERSGA